MKIYLLTIAFGFAVTAGASPFLPGDILVSSGFDTAHEVFEYTRNGNLVQSISIPVLQNQDATDWNRDVLVDQAGHLQVFNGTKNPYISSYDPSTDSWSHKTTSGFALFNVADGGKLATVGHYVFATNNGSGGNGIERLDTSSGQMTLFATQPTGFEPEDVTLGQDGLLYCLLGSGSPRGSSIKVYDPNTMALVRGMIFPSSFAYGDGVHSTNIAVDSAGYIYVNGYGSIYKFTSDCQTVVGSGSYTFGPSYVLDMNLSSDGTFMVTQFDGRVNLLDAALHETSTFNTTGYYASGSFGAFIEPVPEPATLAILACPLLFFFFRPVGRVKSPACRN